ncbi:hypothetical protein HanIR_Chr02g0090931 [Helianthus annuus]|nr:hypothetical protein HanIR_Chr02g0090931 [Helianthus annuus]
MVPKSRANLLQGCAWNHTPYSVNFMPRALRELHHFPALRRERARPQEAPISALSMLKEHTGILTPRGLVKYSARTTQGSSAKLPPVVHKVQVAGKESQ